MNFCLFCVYRMKAYSLPPIYRFSKQNGNVRISWIYIYCSMNPNIREINTKKKKNLKNQILPTAKCWDKEIVVFIHDCYLNNHFPSSGQSYYVWLKTKHSKTGL